MFTVLSYVFESDQRLGHSRDAKIMCPFSEGWRRAHDATKVMLVLNFGP